MMPAALAFEQAPPLNAPLRFFLTAPFYLIGAGALMLLAGPQILVTRWTPATMALAHLVTLGFIVQAMLGAILQVLPVVAGAPVAQVRGVAGVTHIALNLGTVALARGLYASLPWLLHLAAILLAVAIGTIGTGGILALRRAAGVTSPTRTGLKLALGGLAVTATLGILLVLTLTGLSSLPLPQLLSTHVSWGLIGWVLMLVAAVAYQVVPMLQVTPPYPKRLSRALLPALCTALALRSVAAWSERTAILRDALDLALAALVLAFAATTLWLQQRRRRRLRDVTVMFWQLAMASLAAAALLWTAGLFDGALAEDPRFAVGLAVLMLGGFGLSVISGMLYKIVPFLVWFHMQARAPGRSPVKSTKDVIGDAKATWHLIAHGLAFLLLCAAVLAPQRFTAPAAIMTMAAAAILARNLITAARRLRSAAQLSR